MQMNGVLITVEGFWTLIFRNQLLNCPVQTFEPWTMTQTPMKRSSSKKSWLSPSAKSTTPDHFDHREGLSTVNATGVCSETGMSHYGNRKRSIMAWTTYQRKVWWRSLTTRRLSIGGFLAASAMRLEVKMLPRCLLSGPGTWPTTSSLPLCVAGAPLDNMLTLTSKNFAGSSWRTRRIQNTLDWRHTGSLDLTPHVHRFTNLQVHSRHKAACFPHWSWPSGNQLELVFSMSRLQVRNPENACYCPDGFRCLKSGVIENWKRQLPGEWWLTLYPGAFNMAPCKVKPDLATGAPLALSYPHFYMVCMYKKLIQVYNLFQHFQESW